jgi:transcriptional regulator with XRE-family HTH domain
VSKRESVEQRLERGRVEMGARIAHLMRLQGVREARRVTQREVAEAIGVSEATISDCVAGKKPTGKDIVLRLADHFHTTPEFLEYGVVDAPSTVVYTGKSAKKKSG